MLRVLLSCVPYFIYRDIDEKKQHYYDEHF